MDEFNNKFERDTMKRRFEFNLGYFENKPVLLDGRFGKEVIKLFLMAIVVIHL